GRVGRRPKNDPSPFLLQARPAFAPVHVETNLDADRAEIRLEERRIRFARADASLQLVLRRMNFVVPSRDLALPVDQDGRVIGSPACPDADRADDVAGVFAGPFSDTLNGRPGH